MSPSKCFFFCCFASNVLEHDNNGKVLHPPLHLLSAFDLSLFMLFFMLMYFKPNEGTTEIIYTFEYKSGSHFISSFSLFMPKQPKILIYFTYLIGQELAKCIYFFMHIYVFLFGVTMCNSRIVL